MGKLRMAWEWVDDHVFANVWTIAAWPWRRHLVAENIMLGALYVTLVRWALFWGAVCALQWWLIPDWLVSSRMGLQTMFQVIPAVIVAVFVLVLGSVLIIAQQMTTAYGNRSPLMLPQDLEVLRLVARPLVVTMAAVLLAGQVPDTGEPAAPVTAAATTLALMTVGIVKQAAPALPALLFGYSGPVNFGDKVLTSVEDHIRDDMVGLVKFRVAIFGDMLRAGLRRGDSTAVGGAIRGLRLFLEAYMAATKDNPGGRTFTFDDGHRAVGWFGEDLSRVMRAGAEDAMTNVTAEDDMDVVGRALGEFAVEFTKASYEEEGGYMIDALMGTGVSVHQLTPSGAINVFTKSTDGLVRVEKAAEEACNDDLAAKALAAWAVVTGYQHSHFGLEPPPRFEWDVEGMGPAPLWLPAAAVIVDQEFLTRWDNKMPQGSDGPIAWLQWGKDERATHPVDGESEKTPDPASSAGPPGRRRRRRNR